MRQSDFNYKSISTEMGWVGEGIALCDRAVHRRGWHLLHVNTWRVPREVSPTESLHITMNTLHEVEQEAPNESSVQQHLQQECQAHLNSKSLCASSQQKMHWATTTPRDNLCM